MAREQSGFRMVKPGEIDHEIDTSQFFPAPSYNWNASTMAACEAIYRRFVASASGHLIPDGEFCDLPRVTFLDYLATHRNLLLMGSSNPNLKQLEPVVLSSNLIGWDSPRYLGFSSATEAIYLAIVDRKRLLDLGFPMQTTVAVATETPGAGRFYFGLDYRVASEAPWRTGTVYVYSRKDFPEDFQSKPFWTEAPIAPLASITVSPQDWPLLDRVESIDNKVQIERQWETFLGYPWRDDDAIHPSRWKRPVAEAARTHLEANYAEPVGLTQLGRIIGCSPFATLRIFRSVMGQSPKEYQTRYRISKSKELLRRGIPIAEVAIETGFCDQTHLNRHFRQIVGLTPGQYLRTQESPMQAS